MTLQVGKKCVDVSCYNIEDILFHCVYILPSGDYNCNFSQVYSLHAPIEVVNQ